MRDLDLAYRIGIETAQAKAELRATQQEFAKTSESAAKLGKSIGDTETQFKKTSDVLPTLIDRMDAAQREMKELAEWQKISIADGHKLGLSYKEIAAQVGVSEDALRLYNKQLSEADTQQKNTTVSAGAVMKAIAAIGTPLAAAGLASVKMAVELNAGMANIATIVPGNTARINEFKAAIQDMAVVTGKSTGDLAGGMYEIQSSIGDTADVMKILEINAKAGAAGMASTKDAIAFTSAVTKTYGDTSAEAFQKVSDLGFQAVNLGQTTFPELAAAIGGVAPIAKETGISMEEMFAVLATATGVTGNTSQVVTQMSSAITALVSPSKELKGVYEDLGVTSGEALIKQHGLVGSLQLVAKAAKAADIPLIDLLGRKEAWIIASSLAGSQAEKFSRNLAEMGNVAGATDRAFREQTEGVNAAGFAYEQLKQRIVTSMQQAGDAILQSLPPALGGVVVGASEVSTYILSMTGDIAQALIAVKLLSGGQGFAGLIGLLGPTAAGLTTVATATDGVTVAQTAAAASSVTLATRLRALGIVFGQIGVVLAGFYALKEVASNFDAVRVVLQNMQNPFAAAVAGWVNWEKGAAGASRATKEQTESLKLMASHTQGSIKLMASHGDAVETSTRSQRTLASQLQVTRQQVANLTAAQRDEIRSGEAMNLSAKEIAETMNRGVAPAMRVSEEAVKLYVDSLKQGEQQHKKSEAAAKKYAEANVKFNKDVHDSVFQTTKDIQALEDQRMKQQIQDAERSTKVVVDMLQVKFEAEQHAAEVIRELNMSELEFKLDAINREGEARKKMLDLTTQLGRDAAAAVEADVLASMEAIIVKSEEFQILMAAISASMPGYGGFGAFGDVSSLVSGDGTSSSGGRPGRGTFDRWSQQWQQQYGDYSSWGAGVNSGMNAFATYGQAAEDIATGDTPVLRATNVAGRGNRAWRGAVAGAQEGGQYGGAYGAAGGAVAGLIIGLVRNPGFEDVMNRLSHQIGEGISEELARTIDDLGKENKDRGWGRGEAETRSMGSIIGEIGVDDQNIDKLIAKTRDLFVALEIGRFTAEEARATLDESFGYFAEHVVNSKNLASAGFQELIALNQQFGLESESVRQFVEGQTVALGGTISALAAPLVEQYGGLAGAIDLAKQAVAGFVAEGREGTAEHATAVAKLTELQATQAAGAATGAAEVERLGIIAVGAFNASIAAGTGYLEAVEAMGPAIDTLVGLQKDLGIESENAALQELMSFRDRVNNNRTLVMSTEALGETMRALTSIGGMNAETLAAMEAQGLQTYDRLIAAGFTENQTLTMMKDFIINVTQAHGQLGIPIDENTQKLIDQAREAGLLKDKNDVMINTLREGLSAVILAVGGELPEAWQDAAQAAQDAVADMPTEFDFTVNVGYNDPGWEPPPNPDYAAAGGYVGAHCVQYLDTGGRVLGFRPRGTDTVPAMLTPGEGVLSRRGMQALGALNRGEAAAGHITIEKGAIIISGVSDPEEVVDLVMQRLKQRTKYGTAA